MAQRREETLLHRPLKAAFAVAVVAGLVVIAVAAAGWLDVLAAGLAVICCALVAAVSGYAIWQGERALRSRLADERTRVARIRAAQESQLFAWQAEHAARVREWQALRIAYDHQKRWYAVCAPDGVHRVDVAGGTLSGWSAMLATAGAYRLAAGGEVTVLDLTEGSVALDLLGFARTSGIDPLVWVLPADLPRLDLGTGLSPHDLADLLSQVASVSDEERSTRDLSLDHAILERVIDALGGQVTFARVAAALRTLAQVGDPRDDVAAGLLTAGQVDSLSAMFGPGAADRVVLERAWILESQLRKLAPAGTALVPLPRSALRVVALSQRASAVEGKVFGTYLAVALTHALRAAPPGRPWQHTLFVLGADRLRGDTLDRLSDVCESTGTGLVLAYRAIPAHVRQRLGRGNAAVAYMRLGNAEDAKAASEQLGTEHRFVLSQLTETVGLSVTDTTASAYTSTTGSVRSAATSRSVSEGSSRSTGHGYSDGSSLLPSRATFSRNVQDSDSRSTGESDSVSTGISSSTAWGQTTSQATGDSESVALARQRSREFLVEQHELQQLPASAMIITYAAPAGRQVVLADANPGIGGLSAATQLTLEEFRNMPSGVAPPPAAAGPAPESGAGDEGQAAPVSWRSGSSRPSPNLGPPPPRLDWRKRRK
jgi:energy-converting hydrogenase Eha subunit C